MLTNEILPSENKINEIRRFLPNMMYSSYADKKCLDDHEVSVCNTERNLPMYERWQFSDGQFNSLSDLNL